LKGDYNKALNHALAEYRRRPDNIEVAEAVAWAYYKKGDTKNAIAYLQKALKTNCKNPSLLSRAALIYSKANEKEKAMKFATEALNANPNIEPTLKQEVTKLL